MKNTSIESMSMNFPWTTIMFSTNKCKKYIFKNKWNLQNKQKRYAKNTIKNEQMQSTEKLTHTMYRKIKKSMIQSKICNLLLHLSSAAE